MMRRRLAGLLVALMAGACAPAWAHSVTDASGRVVEIDAVDRIISIEGAVTEILVELGLLDKIVAVDTTSAYPAAAAALPKVGYLRSLSAEGILAMKPGLVIAGADAGPPAVLEQLRAAGTTVVLVPNEPSLVGLHAKIAAVAEAVGKPQAGAALAQRVETELAAITTKVAAATTHPRVLFLLSLASGPPMAAGRHTSADAIIRLAGGENATGDFDDYKPLAVEAAIAAQPDVILMPDHAVRAAGGTDKALEMPQVKMTKAGKAGRLVVIDGLLLLGFGPRLPLAVETLFTALHADAGS
jgi:iron complex transport system substrate-binding protein